MRRKSKDFMQRKSKNKYGFENQTNKMKVKGKI